MTQPANDRLSHRVQEVLHDEYGLEVAELRHLATHSNILFRVDVADGRRLVLRVMGPDVVGRANVDIEVAWLSDLVNDPELNLVTPVATPDGRLVVDFDAPRGRRTGVLFTWVPGEPLGEGAGTSGYRALGRLSGRLQRHGAWRPPDSACLRRWDRTFYLETQPDIIDDPTYDHLFHAIARDLRRASQIADGYIARRWSEDEPIFVHGDLHEWNVHLYLGRAWAIDFEDVMLALPAQDVAVSLYAARTRPDLDGLISAFRGGYEEERRWPVADRHELEMYWAARQVMLMNYAGRVLRPDEARRYFGRIMPWLESFLERVASPQDG